MKGIKGFQKGHPVYTNKGQFKKGNVPWNKGIKGYHLSEKHRKRIKETLKEKYKKGELFSEEHREKIRLAKWKGDDIGYRGLHDWVNKELGKPKICKDCGATIKERKIQWANKDHKYKRNLKDWISFCVPCHRKYDRVNNS